MYGNKFAIDIHTICANNYLKVHSTNICDLV